MLVLSVRKLVFQPPNAPKPNFQKGGICFEQNLSAQKGVGARAFKNRCGSFRCESLFLNSHKPPGLTPPPQGGICFEQNHPAFVGDGLDPVGSYESFYFLVAPCSTSWLGLAWLTGVHCLTPLVLLLGSAWPGFLVCLSEAKLGWLGLARLRV